ncbi:MAG: SHOCT domain-containing protein [Planctomycetaceae bacterium]|nr:SHOCT domain-containing protein [Planctomycetaceae bacterium]
MSTLKKLKELLDAGILTQEEFDAKKTELLKRVT